MKNANKDSEFPRPETLLEGAHYCLDNARSLLSDAYVLLGARRIPRAIFLLVTSAEELSKSSLLMTAAGNKPESPKDFWKLFRNHVSKSILQGVMTAMELGDDPATNLAFHRLLREKVLYVDYDGHNWVTPEGSLDLANPWVLWRDLNVLLEKQAEILRRPDEAIINPELKEFDPNNDEHIAALDAYKRAISWYDEVFRKNRNQTSL